MRTSLKTLPTELKMYLLSFMGRMSQVSFISNETCHC